MNAARTAAALVVGNEILTGKTQEANVLYLAQELFALGVALRRVVVCPDELNVIVGDLRALASDSDFVFTSGGIGPTHDDITLEAVAAWGGRRLVQSAEIEALIRAHFKERCTPAHLRMARVPEGAELVRGGEMIWPTVRLGNVFIMPGVPEIFRIKFPVLRELLRAGTPLISRALYSSLDEADIADVLTDLARAHPKVTIGSYLKWRGEDYNVKVTFDGRDARELEECVQSLRRKLPEGSVVRVV